MGSKFLALAWCVLALALASWVGMLLRSNTLNIDSNILSMLPATEADPAVEQAFNNFSERNMRRLLLLVSATDADAARQGASQLAAVLRQNPWIAGVELLRDASRQAAFATFQFEHRHHLLASADAALLAAGDYQAFSEFAISQAYAPFAGGLIELMQRDPFLLSYRFGSSVVAASGGMTLDDGYLQARSGDIHHVLLTAQLIQSPFKRELQLQVLKDIDSVESTWATASPDTRLIRVGALFHTAHAYATASREVSLIGGCSLILVLLLLLMTFRSARPLVLVVVALGFGVLAGFAAVRLVFGEVHLLTIVFGSTLTGVAEDYAFHYFVLDDAGTGQRRLRRILPALSLGLLTSVIGYAALFTTPFPGLQQMALFSICGLAGAWLTVVLLYPCIRLRHVTSPWLLGVCRQFIATGAGKPARSFMLATALLPVLTLVVYFSSERPAEDVRAFQAQQPELLAQEAQLQAILDTPEVNQFYLAKGATPEALLTTLEAAHAELDRLVADGLVDDYVSLAQALPSQRQQAVNYSLYQRLYASDAGQALIAAGLISAERFAAVRADFARSATAYLTPEAWLASPAGAELAYLWLDPDAQTADTPAGAAYASVIALRGIRAPARLPDIRPDEGEPVVFIDKITTVNALLGAYRNSVGVLLIVACLAIFGILLLRYKLKLALIMVAAPVIAISASVLGMMLLGETLGLFSILALFLVIGIGVDFGIFFAEGGALNPATLLAVILSSLTTIFAFGLLALSATTVIHAFGLSMLIGISSVLVLAPVVGNLIAANSYPSNDAHQKGLP